MTTKKLPKDSTKVRDVASGPRGNFWTFSEFFCCLNFDQKPQNRVKTTPIRLLENSFGGLSKICKGPKRSKRSKKVQKGTKRSKKVQKGPEFFSYFWIGNTIFFNFLHWECNFFLFLPLGIQVFFNFLHWKCKLFLISSIAFPIKEISKICIPSAKNKIDLQSQCKK